MSANQKVAVNKFVEQAAEVASRATILRVNDCQWVRGMCNEGGGSASFAFLEMKYLVNVFELILSDKAELTLPEPIPENRRRSLDEFDEFSQTIEMLLRALFDPVSARKYALYELGRFGPYCHLMLDGYCEHIITLSGDTAEVTQFKIWLNKKTLTTATAHEWAAFAVTDYYKQIFPDGVSLNTCGKDLLCTWLEDNAEQIIGTIGELQQNRDAESMYEVMARIKRERVLVLENPPAWAVNPGGTKVTLRPSAGASTQSPELAEQIQTTQEVIVSAIDEVKTAVSDSASENQAGFADVKRQVSAKAAGLSKQVEGVGDTARGNSEKLDGIIAQKAPKKKSGKSKRSWTQPELDDAIREYRSQRAVVFLDLEKQVKKKKPGAKKTAQKMFGRNVIVDALGVRAPAMVTKSEAWQEIAVELQLPHGPRKKLAAAKPARVDFDIAVEQHSQDTSQSAADEAIRRETIGKIKANMDGEAAGATTEKLLRGDLTDEDAYEIAALGREQQADDRSKKVIQKM